MWKTETASCLRVSKVFFLLVAMLSFIACPPTKYNYIFRRQDEQTYGANSSTSRARLRFKHIPEYPQ